MRISFLGAGKTAAKFAEHFYNYINEEKSKNGKCDLEIGGFYNLPLSALPEVILPFNCKLYLDLDTMAEDSDIIAVLCNEDKIQQFTSQFRYLHTCGKIIFHVSRRYNWDILDNDYKNTFASLYSPANLYTTLPASLKDIPFVMEGDGDKLNEFVNILTKTGLNVTLVSRVNANVFLSACKMLEMNLYSALSNAQTAIKASSGINIKSCASLIKHNISSMINNKEAYLENNITPDLNAITVRSHFKYIDKLDMPDYTGMNKYACDVCTRLADIPNDDKHEIEIEINKFLK